MTSDMAAHFPLLTASALLLLRLPLVLGGASGEVNGAVWRDTEGRQIEAHGGGVLMVDGEAYWYGSTKKETDNPSIIYGFSGGVNLYTSSDLLSWRFRGTVFSNASINLPQFTDAVLPWRIERPKVLFNKATRKYVLVFHCEDAPYRMGLRAVATSVSPFGPFQFKGASRPNGLFSMDMTEWEDPQEPGVAYHIRTARSSASDSMQWTVGTRLSADYLIVEPALTFNTSTSTEGQAMIFLGGAYYLLGSHLTGLATNPARLLKCVSPSLASCSSWTDQGNPAVGPHKTPQGDGPGSTFNAQSTFVLPWEGGWVWLGDRWNPDPKQAPGGQHNSTYVWLQLHHSQAGSGPDFTMQWQENVLPPSGVVEDVAF